MAGGLRLRLIIMTSTLTLAISLSCARIIIRREIPNLHGKYLDFSDYGIENRLDTDVPHTPVHYALPPAISTISFISSHNSKPVSYSGFTNHGRGHHDPGYSVEFRQDGFDHHAHHHHVPQHIPEAVVPQVHEIAHDSYY